MQTQISFTQAKKNLQECKSTFEFPLSYTSIGDDSSLIWNSQITYSSASFCEETRDKLRQKGLRVEKNSANKGGYYLASTLPLLKLYVTYIRNKSNLVEMGIE